MKTKSIRIAALCCTVAFILPAAAQNTFNQQQLTNFLNRITTVPSAVPFLAIPPDARSTAMGETGMASLPDVYSIYWNAAKLPFEPNATGAGISGAFSPGQHPGVRLGFATYYNRLRDDRSVIGASVRYFTMGKALFIDQVGNTIGEFRPNEQALDVCYALRLKENFGLSLTTRFIRSNLTNGITLAGQDTKTGTAIAFDLGAYYQKKDLLLFLKPGRIAAGISIRNIGSKISYSSAVNRDFLPVNVSVGASAGVQLRTDHYLGMQIEENEMLVPSAGGVKEKLQEVTSAAGLEYWYKYRFALRAGYHYSPPATNDRQSVSFGGGVRLGVFMLDGSYVVPVNSNGTALENTIRFSLAYQVARIKEMQLPE